MNYFTVGSKYIRYFFWRKTHAKALTKGFANVNNVKLYYEICGTGTPLLLAHGGTAFLESFFAQIPFFASEFQLIMLDTRGHGRSTDENTPFTYHQFAEDVIALLDNLHIPKISLIGWSDGGIIGLDLALNHPDRLIKVIAIGANAVPEGTQPEMLQKMKTLPWKTWNDSRTEKIYRKMSPTPDRFSVFIEKIRTLWTTLPQYTSEQLHKIRTPILFMAGEKEEFIQPKHTKWMAEQVPSSELLLLPNLTHSALLEQPDLLNKIMQEYLQK